MMPNSVQGIAFSPPSLSLPVFYVLPLWFIDPCLTMDLSKNRTVEAETDLGIEKNSKIISRGTYLDHALSSYCSFNNEVQHKGSPYTLYSKEIVSEVSISYRTL